MLMHKFLVYMLNFFLVTMFNLDIYAKLFTLQPPLVQACFHGDPDEVRALLYKKEDVNYQVNKMMILIKQGFRQ